MSVMEMRCFTETRTLQAHVLQEVPQWPKEFPGSGMHASTTISSVSSPRASPTGPHVALTVNTHTTGGTMSQTTTGTTHKPPSSSLTFDSTELSTSFLLRPAKRHVFAYIDPGSNAGHRAQKTPTPHEHERVYVPPKYDGETGSTVVRNLQHTCVATGATVSASQALQEKGVSVLGTDAAGTLCAIQQLSKQLDSFKTRHLFLGQFEMLGRGCRRRGGAHPQRPLLYKHL